ncbi:MAG: hypothetical protein K6F05_00740 [Succinivibrio sp.]|nr:hypothetical protein [Succinivibrio sp.]
MFSIKSLTLESIIDRIYSQNESLTVDKLVELADPQTSIYELAELLCTYINSMSRLVRKADIGSLCNMEITVNELTHQLRAVRAKYDKAVMELIEIKKSEIELEKRCLKLETDNLVLNERLKQRTSQLTSCGFKLD